MNFFKQKLVIVKEKDCSYGSAKKLCSTEDVVEEVNKIEDLAHADTEKLVLIALNTKNQIVSYAELASGSINNINIDMKSIFKQVLLANGSKFILVHNHPSGTVEPSAEDINATRKIKQAAKIMQIEFLDHIILADEENYSIMKNHNIEDY